MRSLNRRFLKQVKDKICAFKDEKKGKTLFIYIQKKQETPRDNEDHSPRTNQPQSKTRCPKVAHLAVDRVEQIRRIVKHYLDTEQIMFPRLSPNYSQGADQQETDERKGRGVERKGEGGTVPMQRANTAS